MSGYSQYIGRGCTGSQQVCSQFADCLQTDENHYYDFDYLIELYSDAFGEQNVIVAPYELLRDDQSAFLGILESKLGIVRLESDFRISIRHSLTRNCIGIR